MRFPSITKEKKTLFVTNYFLIFIFCEFIGRRAVLVMVREQKRRKRKVKIITTMWYQIKASWLSSLSKTYGNENSLSYLEGMWSFLSLLILSESSCSRLIYLASYVTELAIATYKYLAKHCMLSKLTRKTLTAQKKQ